MKDVNKTILKRANAAITRGDYEAFLVYCTYDTEWTFVGEQTLKGKQAVREYMIETYIEPPVFDIAQLIEAGDYLTAIGSIAIKDKSGKANRFEYCDVWTLREGKLAALKAFVVPVAESPGIES